MKRDPKLLDLLEIWQMHALRGLRHGLPCRQEPRAQVIWPTDRIELLENEVGEAALQVRTLQSSKKIAALQIIDSVDRSVTSEAVWTMAICSVVRSAVQRAT